MIINDPSGRAASVTADNRQKVLAATEEFLHALAEVGRAWTLSNTFSQTVLTDNTIFFFQNTDSIAIDFHGLIFSSSVAGLVSIETGRTYSSGGGTALTLGQLNTSSGQTISQTSYFASAIVLAGTAATIMSYRIAANTPYNLLSDSFLIVEPNTTFAIRLTLDSQPATLAFTAILHGLEPWEE